MPHPRRVAVSLIVLSSNLSSSPSFLVVSSRKHKDPLRWVLPKGGIEEGEDAPEAAAREAWEEGEPNSSLGALARRAAEADDLHLPAAGLRTEQAMHLTHLTLLPDAKPHAKSPSPTPASSDFIPSTTYSFELFTVSSPTDSLAPESEWLESEERDRKWVEGWEELERTICWGRREEVMRSAIGEARKRLG